MKCTYCGFDREEPFAYCPSCGAPAEAPAEVPAAEGSEAPKRNAVAERLLPALKSGRFLAICILLSISYGCTLFAGSMDVLALLMMIFSWIVYANARKNVLSVKQLRSISGTVYANYVVHYIGMGSLAFIGLLCLLPTSLGPDAPAIGIIGGNGLPPELLEEPGIGLIVRWLLHRPLQIIGTFLLIYAAAGILLNFFGTHRIHALAKSTYTALAAADLVLLRHVNGARIWLWVFGICNGINAFSDSFFVSASYGCKAAACILAALLVKSTFLDEKETV